MYCVYGLHTNTNKHRNFRFDKNMYFWMLKCFSYWWRNPAKEKWKGTEDRNFNCNDWGKKLRCRIFTQWNFWMFLYLCDTFLVSHALSQFVSMYPFTSNSNGVTYLVYFYFFSWLDFNKQSLHDDKSYDLVTEKFHSESCRKFVRGFWFD